MSIHVYPDQLRQILAYIEALDAVDKKMIETPPDYPIGPKPIQLHGYEDGAEWGTLQDEIGGAWSWRPPEHSTGTKPDNV